MRQVCFVFSLLVLMSAGVSVQRALAGQEDVRSGDAFDPYEVNRIAGRRRQGGLPPPKESAPDAQQGAPHVPKVNGRLPRNSHHAGKTVPLEELPKELREKYPNSIRFTEDGFPDFSPYAIKTVSISFTGDRKRDAVAANAAAGVTHTPVGYTWHHHQDGKTLQLVPTDLHRAISHTGGHAALKSQETAK